MCSVIRAIFQPPVSLLGRPWQQLSYPNTAEWAKRPQNFTLRRPGAPTLKWHLYGTQNPKEEPSNLDSMSQEKGRFAVFGQEVR